MKGFSVFRCAETVEGGGHRSAGVGFVLVMELITMVTKSLAISTTLVTISHFKGLILHVPQRDVTSRCERCTG